MVIAAVHLPAQLAAALTQASTQALLIDHVSKGCGAHTEHGILGDVAQVVTLSYAPSLCVDSPALVSTARSACSQRNAVRVPSDTLRTHPALESLQRSRAGVWCSSRRSAVFLASLLCTPTTHGVAVVYKLAGF